MSRPVVLIAGGGTGGHVFPGLAVADAMTALADVEVVFGGSPRGIEKNVVPPRGYRLEMLDISPIKGGGVSRAARGAWSAARATLRALRVVRQLSPVAVLSVGGYAAGPFALASVLRAVPLGIMEPNDLLGFTNRVLAPFAQRAYIAWSDLTPRVRSGSARVFGVPLRRGFKPSNYVPSSGALRVLVMGGSQGAQALNQRVPRAIAGLAAAFPGLRVVHQTGRGAEAEVAGEYAQLGFESATVLPFLDDVPEQLAAADIVIARSGAGSVAEVAAVGRASLLVPFPFAADDHQAKNARALERAGGSVCVLQQEATVERIARELGALLADASMRVAMADAARAVGKPDAAHAVALDLLQLAGVTLRDASSASASSPGAAMNLEAR